MMITEEKIRQNINELLSLNDKRKGKYRRNYRSYNYTPYASLESIRDPSVVGYFQKEMDIESDVTGTPQLNVIKSCIDTLVSKISQSKVRPYFNVQNGDLDSIQVCQNAQDFFDLYYDDQKVNKKVSEAFRDACIFDTGVIYIDEENQTVERALPWQVYVRPSEALYNKISRVYYELKEYPTNAIKEYKGNKEYCTYGIYYDIKAKVKAIFVDNKCIYRHTYDKEVIPFIFLHYSSPITGLTSISIVDMLFSIQDEIDVIMNKIKLASQLSPALSFFVPEGSTIKAGQLNNRVGNVFTYKQAPNQNGSPVTVSTPAMIDNQYINILNELITKAYEMVGITQLSAQGAKPTGVNSGVAMATLENVESERFEVQLSNVIRAYVDIAETCIKVFDGSKNILPKDKRRANITWSDILKESKNMFIQYSAADALSKDPSVKMQQIDAMVQKGWIPQSRATQLMELPDIQTGYSIVNNSLKAVRVAIDKCLKEDIYEVPEYVPYSLLMEEIVNYQLSLYSVDNKENKDYLEKLDKLYSIIEEIENEVQEESADQMGDLMAQQQEIQGGGAPMSMTTPMEGQEDLDVTTDNTEQVNEANAAQPMEMQQNDPTLGM